MILLAQKGYHIGVGYETDVDSDFLLELESHIMIMIK